MNNTHKYWNIVESVHVLQATLESHFIACVMRCPYCGRCLTSFGIGMGVQTKVVMWCQMRCDDFCIRSSIVAHATYTYAHNWKAVKSHQAGTQLSWQPKRKYRLYGRYILLYVCNISTCNFEVTMKYNSPYTVDNYLMYNEHTYYMNLNCMYVCMYYEDSCYYHVSI